MADHKMSLINKLKRKIRIFIINRLGVGEGIGKYNYKLNRNIKNDIEIKYGFKGDLVDIFSENRGSIVHKWHHYIPLYDKYFSTYRNKKIRFLEIGVSQGGSLQIWRRYFGEDAIIYGIDIDPMCSKFNGIAGQVRIGSQDDTNFLASVIKEMGGVDIILDDGSHKMSHVNTTFKFLFQKLNFGGIYMIEDLHTAYWKSNGGGYDDKNNFFKIVPDLINDMHHWYHGAGITYPEISSYCTGIHIHDSIAVFEKSAMQEPTHSEIH